MLSTLFFVAALSAHPEPVDTAPALQRQTLPTEFRNNRVFVTPSHKGQRIAFYTDTGGGWNAIRKGLIETLGATIESEKGDEGSIDLIAFPKFDSGHEILDAPRFMQNRLMVAADAQLNEWGDGFLGGRWFADRVWEFDYPRQQLSVLTGWRADKNDVNRAALGFQTLDGERTMHFPSLSIRVDGRKLDVLLDTGATAKLTATSAPAFDLEPGTQVGASFIIHSVFERWTRDHPDWRMLDAADAVGGSAQRMIEVPEVDIAGLRVGPVWFAERPDTAFKKYMASMMDRPTSGAIGGSAFRYLRMVIDYPGAAAYFYRDK